MTVGFIQGKGCCRLVPRLCSSLAAETVVEIGPRHRRRDTVSSLLELQEQIPCQDERRTERDEARAISNCVTLAKYEFGKIMR